VLRLFFTAAGPIEQGQSTTIDLHGYGIMVPQFTGTAGAYQPRLNCGAVTYLTCCLGDRGDVDGNGAIDIADVVTLVNYMFKQGPLPPCIEEADVNAHMRVDIADLVYLVNYMFKQGLPPEPCP
jgi:hypothetical protein